MRSFFARASMQTTTHHFCMLLLQTDMFRLAALDVVERFQAGFLQVVCAVLLVHHAQVRPLPRPSAHPPERDGSQDRIGLVV